MDNLPENETRGLQLLLTIADAVAEVIMAEFDVVPELARTLGLRSADRVRKERGGEQMYIPKGLALEIAERDWQIWEDFGAADIKMLAKKYDRTERQIYNILARCRVEHDRKHQMELFACEDGQG